MFVALVYKSGKLLLHQRNTKFYSHKCFNAANTKIGAR